MEKTMSSIETGSSSTVSDMSLESRTEPVEFVPVQTIKQEYEDAFHDSSRNPAFEMVPCDVLVKEEIGVDLHSSVVDHKEEITIVENSVKLEQRLDIPPGNGSGEDAEPMDTDVDQYRISRGASSSSREVLNTKLKQIMKKYHVELERNPVFCFGSQSENFKFKWPFFELISFGKDILLPSITTENPLQSALYQDSDDNDSLDIACSDNCGPPTPLPQSTGECSRSSYSSATSHKKPLENTKHDFYHQVVQQKLQIIRDEYKRRQEYTNKSDYHFFMSLLPYLVGLSPQDNLEVRKKIQNIVFEAYRCKENTLNEEKQTVLNQSL